MDASSEPTGLDQLLEALANSHRRAILHALSLQPCAINQLAEMRGLSLPAIHKHIKVMEGAGLVRRKKIGRTNYLALSRGPLRDLQTWINQYHTYWGSDEETLENYVHYLGRQSTEDEETR